MLLKLLDRLGRKRIIMDRVDGEPYLERYYLFLRERGRFPFNLFLHRFLKSDPDHVHDHPWPYATVILKGGYYEWIPQFDSNGKLSCEIRKWRGVGHARICSADSFHRIELAPGVDCWTLFMPGPHRREWGFLVHNRWIQWQHYLQLRKSHGK